MKVYKTKVKKVEQLDDFQDEYVYDIGIKGDTPYFFANNILVHNSNYFTASTLKNNNDYKDFFLNRDYIVQLYESIVDEVNSSFPMFMNESFNTGLERGSLIKAGLELIASKGLFIKKKKYACLNFYKEGKRLDIDNQPGKMKIMGLDLKRSDTPKYMQEFLEGLLFGVLTDMSKEEIFKRVREFRTRFLKRDPWEKGTPKKVNALSDFGDRENKIAKFDLKDVSKLSFDTKMKVNMPGHVRAALNYNKLRKMNNDNYSPEITDGSKTIVCKLKPNPLKLTSISYPVDMTVIPEWFKKLPFDQEEMTNVIIFNKLDNLLGVLGWDFSDIKKGIEDFGDLIQF